jgi:hypothetical protein
MCPEFPTALASMSNQPVPDPIRSLRSSKTVVSPTHRAHPRVAIEAAAPDHDALVLDVASKPVDRSREQLQRPRQLAISLQHRPGDATQTETEGVAAVVHRAG